MSTTKTQRIGIWIIAIFMAVGTIGSFVIIILANDNSKADQARLSELQASYQRDADAYTAKKAAQTEELSQKYFAVLNQFSSRVAPFNKDEALALKTEDLLVGDGDELTDRSSFTAYYIGWNPEGTIFDSSISGTTLKAPIGASPGGVIQGWTQGVAGMRVGGARELTIPSELAYGESGSGTSIAPNTPLKFIVLVIPTPEAIPQPTVPSALLRYYQTGRF